MNLEPIVAIATALRPSALGIVRASGAGSIEKLSGFFSRPEALKKAATHTLVYGWVLEPESRTPVDEVVVAVYRAPRGFTGEDAVEVTCHGGPAVVTAIFSCFIKAGFRQAEGGEFTMRAFLNGKTDLTRAEAAAEIIDAKTAEARRKASVRLAGSVAKAFAAIRAKVLEAAAALAVEIEYPEDEDTVKGAFNVNLIQDAIDSLKALESTWAAERLYQNGAAVVIAGATNAGKSRLFNFLLKEERAIVSDIHGTTRDWIESDAAFLGLPVRLFDTAGLRDTANPIEAEGIARSRALIEGAEAILYVVDSTRGFTEEDAAFFANADAASERSEDAPKEKPVFVVWNKTDLAQSLPLEAVPACVAHCRAVRNVFPLSAKTGAGLNLLVQGVRDELLAGTQGSSSDASLGSLRQKKAAESARLSLQAALANAESGFPLDAVAQDIDDALSALGEVTGECASADVLNEVFSKFCVGK